MPTKRKRNNIKALFTYLRSHDMFSHIAGIKQYSFRSHVVLQFVQYSNSYVRFGSINLFNKFVEVPAYRLSPVRSEVMNLYSRTCSEFMRRCVFLVCALATVRNSSFGAITRCLLARSLLLTLNSR